MDWTKEPSWGYVGGRLVVSEGSLQSCAIVLKERSCRSLAFDFQFWCACFRIPCRHELCMQAVTMSYHYIFHNFPSIYNSIQDARQRSIAVMLAKRLVMHTFLLSLQVWMYALTERERERERQKRNADILYTMTI